MTNKNFVYDWPNELFLLHIELKICKSYDENKYLNIKHVFSNEESEEMILLPANVDNHRFIISKSKPNEKGIRVEYPTNIILEAYEVDDRAYYPTQSFFKN